MERFKGTVKGKSTLYGILSMPVSPPSAYQDKAVIPTDTEQVIEADKGYTGLRKVTVAAISSNYGRISFNGYQLRVE
ncbi:MAG: hypothetical protein MR586_01990 [Megasphaera elsdenii]|nr:hypothetical protein [Megasphaera elsdenii]DAP86505.1 MAG TPA: hypothetical protein [Caudoviricetes sp.]